MSTVFVLLLEGEAEVCGSFSFIRDLAKIAAEQDGHQVCVRRATQTEVTDLGVAIVRD